MNTHKLMNDLLKRHGLEPLPDEPPRQLTQEEKDAEAEAEAEWERHGPAFNSMS